MATYRHFRNTDPPSLVQLWNESLTGRGAVRLRHSSMLEYQVFAKPYFDPAGLIVAEEDGRIIGFVHGGFGPDEKESQLCYDRAVICALAVHPSYRRRGIATELLKRCEAYLLERGANKIFAGAQAPNDPFYQQLYGGCELPGFLESDELAGPFFQQRGYSPGARTLVFQCDIPNLPAVADPRFVNLRHQYEIYADAMRARSTWWHNCELSVAEPMEFTVQQGEDGMPLAHALVVELDGYGMSSGPPAVGILDLQVKAPSRRQGIAKFLMTQMLLFLQEQSYKLAEIHAAESNDAALSLFQGLGFKQVDAGIAYQKDCLENN